MAYQLKELPNGIRIVHQEITHTRLVHCGFILDIGSRDETPEEEGLAHFWEHMAFKGTKKRKAFHIINRLESLGGELNAYTTKEKICFYSSVLHTHFAKAAELLCDITFDSIFPPKQIEKERQVILEEMAMYRDSPDDSIQDDFDALLFQGHPLGGNILGNERTVSGFAQKDFKAFIEKNLDTRKIVFSVVGNIPWEKVLRTVEGFLSAIPSRFLTRERLPFTQYVPKLQTAEKEITQAHMALGKVSYGLSHPYRYPFFLLNNILGGPSMNSRLNMALREKNGYVYGVEAHYQTFHDVGFWGIFFATEVGTLTKAHTLVRKELKKLREKKLGTLQLHMAKEQAVGQMAMAEENYAALMLVFGKNILDKNEIPSLESIFELIRSTRAETLQEIAQEMFAESELSTLTYKPA
ncbi:peptidase M16 domain-containing protein [Nitritalea halalkaliphila LW7]|uniref:Peptidase M16 domain-containing protein n=1 Tax=Nitritalea halalkaliphila LW7 TaxID=1189621 RepID=I5C0S5_9BACT|nr:pitrilysin family protein [Nitritalea halalkaliphila]EIM75427.1 peptidase M16 domain-containing protein [Nitritalea halalkaliphila LW7]